MISSEYGGYFPYPEFKENQELMLDKVKEIVLKGNHTVLMIDAPTGSGKTSVIAPILANKGDKKLIVAVRTHSQIQIYLDEIKKIRNKTSKKPSIAYIIGKEKICKFSVNPAICDSLVENTRILIKHKINELQLEKYDASFDEEVIEVIKQKFDGKNPIGIEHFFDEKENTLTRNEKEMLICPYYLFSKIGHFNNDSKISFSNSSKIEAKAHEFLSHPLPPDQAKEICNDVCPYEALAITAKDSDVTVLMHQHILNEPIRKRIYKKLGLKQEDTILLIDEAHNIGEETEQNTSEKLDINLIDSAIQQLEDFHSFNWEDIPGKDTFKLIDFLKDNFGFNNVITDKKIEDYKTIIISTEKKSISLRLNNEETKAILIIDGVKTDEFPVNKKNVILKTFKNIDSEEVHCTNNTFELLYNILLKLKGNLERSTNEHYFTPELLNNNLFKNLDRKTIDNIVNKSVNFSKLLSIRDDSDFDENNPLNKVALLLSIANDLENNDKYILRIGQDETNKKNIVLELINLDPSPIFSKIADSHYATIMMSGTFSPIDFYELYYFGKNGKAELYPLPNSFPSQNRLIIGITDVNTLFDNRDDKTNYKKSIDTFITDIPGNIALFFTSNQMKRDYTKHCIEITRKNNKEFFDQENGIPDEIFENFKNAAKNKGGVLIAPCHGKLSEGKDYPGDSLKGAMMIGLPLGPPGSKNKFQESKDEYFEKLYGKEKGGFIAYQLPAMNKALQALGRVIRDKDETGILILADSRFIKDEKYSIWQYLPSWIKDEMITCNSLQIGVQIKNWKNNVKLKETQKIMEVRKAENDLRLKDKNLYVTDRKKVIQNVKLVKHEVDSNPKISKDKLNMDTVKKIIENQKSVIKQLKDKGENVLYIEKINDLLSTEKYTNNNETEIKRLNKIFKQEVEFLLKKNDDKIIRTILELL